MLVLKGPLTRVTDGKAIYHSPFGGPVLARGGSGDVLAGLIGGLLAQQPDNPLQAAMRGVVWHGRAADLLARTHGQVAVEISEILTQLGPALTSLTMSDSP
ncbi:MAG: NAD(P)H-hydrate dehydratase [Lacunisphaera sp.]